MEKVRKICLDFHCKGGTNIVGYHLTNWNSITKPKDEGDWRLTNIHLFIMSLATKYFWKITSEILWKRIILQKYIAHGTILN